MWLVFKSGDRAGRSIEVAGDSFTVGRDAACELTLDDVKLSRRHARLRALADGRAVLEDLNSTNGTYVNGWRMDRAVTLGGGEQVQFGDTVLEASLQQPADAGATQFGVIVQPPGQPVPERRSQSAIQRVMLQRSVRRLTLVAGAALAFATVAVVLLVTGALSGDDDGDGASGVADIVEQVTPSTALITSIRDGQPFAGGTGWVLDAEEGLIVTNYHVVNGGDAFAVAVDGDEQEATIVGAAPCEDLAVLEVDDTDDLVTLPLLEDQDTLRPGQNVVAVGFPGSASADSNLTTTTGVVSVVKTEFDETGIDTPHYENVVQTDAAINPGNSGGPLVDGQGRLVGVNTAVRTLDSGGQRIIQGQGYAIGVDRVREITEDLREGDSIAWTGLGLVSSLTQPNAPTGLIVAGAVPGTAAEDALGDAQVVVTAIDGTPMDGSLVRYCDAVGDRDSGDEAVFTVTDGSQSAQVRVPFE
ncbi:MAG: trypsin-like peptidase domain-containing protein [Thermoleophilaceae bacterium]